MAGGIGTYRDWAVILPRTLAAPDATGEAVESWLDPPDDDTAHAARVESPAGSESTSAPRQSGDSLRLRFRCKVDIDATARVRLVEADETYAVSGVWTERAAEGRGWQTVCDLSGPV